LRTKEQETHPILHAHGGGGGGDDDEEEEEEEEEEELRYFTTPYQIPLIPSAR
jgi:hypothetical protein